VRILSAKSACAPTSDARVLVRSEPRRDSQEGAFFQNALLAFCFEAASESAAECTYIIISQSPQRRVGSSSEKAKRAQARGRGYVALATRRTVMHALAGPFPDSPRPLDHVEHVPASVSTEYRQRNLQVPYLRYFPRVNKAHSSTVDIRLDSTLKRQTSLVTTQRSSTAAESGWLTLSNYYSQHT
jgi:hypothetical protein